jgi:hypothetical protein
MTPEQLMAIPGIGEKMVEKIQLSVAEYFQNLESQQAAESDESAIVVDEALAGEPPDEFQAEGSADVPGDVPQDETAEGEAGSNDTPASDEETPAPGAPEEPAHESSESTKENE